MIRPRGASTPLLVATGLLLGGLVVVTPPADAAPPRAPGTFAALRAARIADTRHDLGGPAAPAGGTTSIAVTGVGGVPADGVSAVVLSVTVIGTRSGLITAYPAGRPRPGTSNLNFAQGVPVSNEVVVAPGAGGRVTFANTSSGTTQLTVDVHGYYYAGVVTTPGGYRPTTPTRVVDTRTGLGSPPPGAFGTAALPVAGRAGVPADASAVVLNLTETGAQASGYLVAYPHGRARPPTSTLNFPARTSVPNAAVVPVGTDGLIDVHNHSSRPVQLVADLLGYYLGGTPDEPGAFVPINPTRDRPFALGTNGFTGISAPTNGTDDNPEGAVVNVTVSRQSSSSWLTADPNAITPRYTNTSTVNYRRGVSIASAATTRGVANAYNRSGSVLVTVDRSGYFLSSGTTPGGGGVRGRVARPDGTPAAAARILVFPPPPYGGDTFPVAQGSTDSAGDYRVLGLPAGRYVVCASAGTYVCYPDDPSPCEDACDPIGDPISVAARTETTADVVVPAA